MKLCANENIPGDCVTALRQKGHDVVWVREFNPGIQDSLVLEMSHSQERLLITFDKDFGDLVFRRGAAASSGVVPFRLRRRSPTYPATQVARILDSRTDWNGHFSVVDEHSIRMRPLQS